ncbi:MAG TPA: branched-chain amino acid ABC transporter permease [Thermodesulfobacteriota bacterium]
MTEYLIALATLIGIQTLLALGLNLHYGITGLVNFGHVAFYAIGAYSSAILSVTLGWPPVAGLLVGVCLAIAASLLIGTATLRLREDYFAILTLGFSELVRLFLTNARGLTRGVLGISDIPRLASIGGVPSSHLYLLLVVATVAAAYAICEVLTRSPLGRTLRAVRDDDVAAASLGKDVLAFRLTALAVGAAIAAVAGTLSAHYISYVSPDQFTPEITFYAWMAMIIGRPGSMRGALLGTAILYTVLEGTRFAKDVAPGLGAPQVAAIRQVVIGLGLIVLTVWFRRVGARRAV